MKTYKKNSFASSIKKHSPKPVIEISEIQMEKLKNYGQVLLCILGIAGVLTVAAVMPGALGAFKTFQKLKRMKGIKYEAKNQKIAKTFYYLKKKNYIDILKERSGYKIVLTKKGKARLKKLKFSNMSIPKPKVWDGKFWQVAADVPTKYRRGADALRSKLRAMNFCPLQKTLWFYPFDPRKEIEFIARNYNISRFVTVMKIENFDRADKSNIEKYFEDLRLI